MPAFRQFLRTFVLLAGLCATHAALAEPLDDARDARRVGDVGVLGVLRNAEADASDVVVAIRRARFLRMPALALEPLARIATGRDPTLAPEAAFTAHAIAIELDPQTLEALEIDAATLRPARDALNRLARDASARADLRALAANAVAHLDALAAR